MSDYIKREDAIEEFEHRESYSATYIRGFLKHLPSADVAPVRHGRWEVIDEAEPRRYGCSICRRLSWYMDNYCPYCGARMDGDENEID